MHIPREEDELWVKWRNTILYNNKIGKCTRTRETFGKRGKSMEKHFLYHIAILIIIFVNFRSLHALHHLEIIRRYLRFIRTSTTLLFSVRWCLQLQYLSIVFFYALYFILWQSIIYLSVFRSFSLNNNIIQYLHVLWYCSKYNIVQYIMVYISRMYKIPPLSTNIPTLIWSCMYNIMCYYAYLFHFHHFNNIIHVGGLRAKRLTQISRTRQGFKLLMQINKHIKKTLN